MEQQALLETLDRLRELPHEDATVEFKSNGVIHREGLKPTAVWRLGPGNPPPP